MRRLRTLVIALILFLTFAFLANSGQAETLYADVVVIGSGASGLTAALTAAEGGAQVIVFEKRGVPGGTTNFAEGIFAAESKYQRAKNIAITKNEAFNYIMEYSHWRADARLVRAFVDKAPETIEWLEKQGVEFIEPAANYPGGYMTWHIVKGRGSALVKTLLARAQEKGVKVYLNTPAKKILTDEKGKIVGVMAQSRNDGQNIQVNTKAVIIATGGYANNKEMLAKYTNFGDDVVPVGNIEKTGDGIQMAWAVGAAERGVDVLQLYRPGIPGETPESHLNAPARQPYLWINSRGERFCNEGIIFSWPFAGNALANQPGRIMYVIFDENTKKYMMEKGIDVGVGVMVPVATKLTRLESELQRGLAKGYVFMADSIAELATKIAVNPAKLQETIDEYNRMCDQREDTLFGKNAKYLQPVRQPKFYAMKCLPHILGTLGGIKINHRTEVLNKKLEVIPGLYAVGNDAGGMYGDSYDVVMAGGTFGFAVNSGRIAGKNALKYIGK